MRDKIIYFKKSSILPIDEFFSNVLYDKEFGYYTSKNPFGRDGDFITSPKISNLFSEIIGIWIISVWENFGKPKNFNFVELGPGDGSLTKVLINVFERFPEFNAAKKIFLYEKSRYQKKLQKEKIESNKVKWINNFNIIKKGPVLFFGNEFFDAIPIKQFKKSKNFFLEKYYTLNKHKQIKSLFKKASRKDINYLKSFKTLKNQTFIEFPKLGFEELKKIGKKIFGLSGCILLIDYGYYKPDNKDTLQSVINHKKNKLLNNLGKADITSHVNFSLLNEFFKKNKLKIKKTVTQKEFLEKMGIIERAESISKKMTFKEKTNLYFRLRRLLSPKMMGSLFKVSLAYKARTRINFKY